jgi:hypothetical protein
MCKPSRYTKCHIPLGERSGRSHTGIIKVMLRSTAERDLPLSHASDPPSMHARIERSKE